jgi:hypothetical protein
MSSFFFFLFLFFLVTLAEPTPKNDIGNISSLASACNIRAAPKMKIKKNKIKNTKQATLHTDQSS